MAAEPFCLCFSKVNGVCVHLSSELLAGSFGQLTSVLVLIVCSDLGREGQKWSMKNNHT